MPHVTTNYKMYVPGGHHRQPRNTGAEFNLAPTSGSDVPNPGSYTPPYFPQLPYDIGGGNAGIAKLLFWNVTDGTTGQVLPPAVFDQPVAEFPLTITGWYWPITGPASNGGGPGTSIIDDAFSAALGRFIDDTFVAVTSDPSLTNDANVTGVVPTTTAVTLQANASVLSTSEPFRQWVLNDAIMPVDATTLDVAKNTDGIAIAIYQAKGRAVVIRPSDFQSYYQGPAIIIGGVRVDGPGIIIIGGVPHPVGPWGPLMEQLAKSATVIANAKSLDKKASAQIHKLAAQDAVRAIKAALPAFVKETE
jgi:hypothetical protein